jgi:hypothetical protein
LKNSGLDRESGGEEASIRFPSVANISFSGMPWLRAEVLYSFTIPSEISTPTHCVT